MTELRHSSPTEVARFIESLGYPIKQAEIAQVYPVHFSDRKVFRVTHDTREDEVLKVRPKNDKADRELRNLITLFSSYRFSGAAFPTVRSTLLEKSGYIIFHMSYLGPNLGELVETLDLIEYGYMDIEANTFQGFSNEEIRKLIKQLKSSHRNFASKHGCIHGDLIQHSAPNNIIYSPQRNCLLLVDAEALVPSTDERLFRFNDQIDKVEEWMHASLLTTS